MYNIKLIFNMKNRIFQIDLIRGLVIFLMTIDHIVHCNPFIKMLSDPIDIASSSKILIILRLIGHLCAPTFVLLCGVSVYIKQQNISKNVSNSIIKRGFILILMEFSIITFGWTLTLNPYKIFLQVIFAIGVSLIALGVMIKWLHRWNILYISLGLIVSDNLITFFNIPKPDNQFFQVIWAVFHEKTVFWLFDKSVFIRTTYPVLSWIGVIGIGYFLGDIYYKNKPNKIKKLTQISLGILITGFIFRYFTCFGEGSEYIKYSNFSDNVLSLLNFTKYPPSLIFLTTFCSIAILLLNLSFKFNARSEFFEFLGRNSIVYYVIHIYVITLFYRVMKYLI
jgi:uncharacterized membrane protein